MGPASVALVRALTGLLALAFVILVVASAVTIGMAGWDVLWTERWAMVTLADLYLGVVIFVCVIGFAEGSWLRALAWGIPLACLGNPVAALWLIVRGPKVLLARPASGEVAEG